MTIEERLEALTMNLELASRDIQDLRSAIHELRITAQQDGENIRALARIAEIHERRLSHLEGEDT
jgi:archaellum component FlaC